MPLYLSIKRDSSLAYVATLVSVYQREITLLLAGLLLLALNVQVAQEGVDAINNELGQLQRAVEQAQFDFELTRRELEQMMMSGMG